MTFVERNGGADGLGLAVDEIAGIVYPRVKLVMGEEDSVDPIGQGFPLPVTPIPLVITTTPGAYTVTTSSTEALAANANRKFLSLGNSGTKDIFCAFGTAAVLDAGFFIPKDGGCILFHMSTGVDTRALNVITDTGTTGLSILEGV